MVLEHLRPHRKTPKAQLELPGDYLEKGLQSIRQGITDFTMLIQEKPDLNIGLMTEPEKGHPLKRPGPTIHDFFQDIGWSYDNEDKSLTFSEEENRLAFTVTHVVEQRKEQLIVIVDKNRSLIELQFKIKHIDGEELSKLDQRLETQKQTILSKSLEDYCSFSGNQAVFVHNLVKVIEDSRQLALVA